MYFPDRHSSTDSCPLEVPNMPKPQSCQALFYLFKRDKTVSIGMKIPCNLRLMSTVIHPGITSHSTASSHPPFSVGWVSSYLGGFLWGGFWALFSVLPLCPSLAVARLAPESFPVGFMMRDLARWIVLLATKWLVYLMVAGVTAPCSLCLLFIHVPFNLHQRFG